MKPVILVLLGALWPNNDSTGPAQSFVALTEALADDFVFKVIALDRPLNSSAQATVRPGIWIQRKSYMIRYFRHSFAAPHELAAVINQTPHHILMMNGFFDQRLTIPALSFRQIGGITKAPVLLSTRGEFGPGALSIKRVRKRIFLSLARHIGLHRDILLHATNERELEDIQRVYPYSKGVVVAPNIRTLEESHGPSPPPLSDRTRLVFLGRITPVKNLEFALDVLSKVAVPVEFDLYGPIEDQKYWLRCQCLMQRQPEYVTVNYKGEVSNDRVLDILPHYDLLFSPTLGENFGHSILDALEAGIPVLISDKTPFSDIGLYNAGWSLPLDEPQAYRNVIDRFATISHFDKTAMRRSALNFFRAFVQSTDAVKTNKKMLLDILASKSPDAAKTPL